ncbi:MAG: hypothetical protein AAFU84_18860 [Cyanobacteria bacterium J06633_23]
MRRDIKPKSMETSMRRLVLISAFRLSMVWDLFTTFLGTLIILGSSGFIPVGLSLVGTLMAGAFNFSTKSIWERRRLKHIEIYLLRMTWVLAIAFDFWTSLTCNATYIAVGQFELGPSVDLGWVLGQLTSSQLLIVLFITILTTISPMMVGYIRDRAPDFLV